jgi:serine/threonine protein kinase
MEKKFANYRLLEKLGEGGAAEVYLATPLVSKPFANPGDPVAVKIYKQDLLKKEKEQIERIRLDMKASMQTAHPNVVRVFESSDDHPEGAHLVMEYVDGMPLSRWGAMFCPISDRLLLNLVRHED